MKYKFINIILLLPKALGRFLGTVFRPLPDNAKAKIISAGSFMTQRAFGKIKPILYHFFYDFTKSAVQKPLLLKKEVISGGLMTLDVSQKTQRQIFLYPKYEGPIRNMLEKNLKRGDVFLDIGANVGYYTIIGSVLVGAGGAVYAFEPEVSNYSKLKEAVNHNRLTNVTIMNLAIGSGEEEGVIYLNPLNEGGHSLMPRSEYADSGRKISRAAAEKIFPKFSFEQRIQVTTLDNFFSARGIKNVAVIKVDIEGYELEAIHGMKEVLSNGLARAIICEVGEHSSSLRKEMAAYGYLAHSIMPDGSTEAFKGDVLPSNNYAFIKR